MKKFLIASGVAVVAFASIAAAQGYQFSTNLTVGSTGPDVVALQTWLIANGYHIPSVESGAAAKGYYGSQTKTAVAKFQAASGLPSTGFFGPLTRGILNGGSAMTTGTSAATCPAGYVCTAVPGTTPSTPAGPVGISTPGVPGTLSVSLWTSPSNGTIVYKGQSYDVVSVKAQAAASDMAVQSVSMDFSNRLWLYATTITLKDDQGNVVGQVSNLGPANFSELTVGTDYRITIPVNNYVVKATQTRYLTANITFLTTSDRQTGTIGVSAIQVRSVDGTGVTDTETVNSGNTQTTTDSNGTTVIRTFSYQGSGAGQVNMTVDATSPLAGLVQISTAAQTQNVPLAVYSLKSQNAPSNLQSVAFTVYTTGTTPSALFSTYSLKIGSQTFGAQNIVNNATVNGQASSTVTFSNFGSIVLPADQPTSLSLMATVQQDTNNVLDGAIASTTLTNAGVVAQDQSYNNISVTGGPFASSNLTFSASSATLSNLTATLGSSVINNNTTVAYNTSFSFTLTAGNSTLYVSADPNVALSTTSTGFGSTASSSLPLSGVTTNPGQISGDTNVSSTNGFYVVPAGTSRQFTFQGTLNNTNGASGFKSFSITAVKYGTTTSSFTTGTINYNLQPLKVTATF